MDGLDEVRQGIDRMQRMLGSRRIQSRLADVAGVDLTQQALNVLRAGASGYVNKEMAPEELLTAVRSVLRGRRYVTPLLAELLVSELDGDADKPLHARLSQREFQIFCKLAQGESVSEIASRLFLSVKTVSTYRSRILEKMSMKSNADITTYALRNNLVQ